jgi:hypothetical protein
MEGLIAIENFDVQIERFQSLGYVKSHESKVFYFIFFNKCFSSLDNHQ